MSADGSISGPVPGQIHVVSDQVAVVQSTMSALAVDYRLEPLDEGISGVVSGRILGGVKMAFARYGRSTRSVIPATEEQVVWSMPLGPARMRINGSRRPMESVGQVIERDQDTVVYPSPQDGARVLTTSEQRLRVAREELFGENSSNWHVLSGRSSPEHNGLIESATRHVTRVLSAGTLLTEPVLRSLENTLLTAMLVELPATVSTSPRSALRASSGVHADRAVAWARLRIGTRFSIEQWAAGVGISVRHLQKVFRDTYGTTPGDYLMAMRLTRARSLLETPGSGRSVAEVAAQVGIGHLGRFASAYRERFDELPSQTLRVAGPVDDEDEPGSRSSRQARTTRSR